MPTLQDLQNQRQNFFKQQRQQALGQENANLQQNREALQRRFTSMGAANTGAALKADQNALNQSAINRQNALQGIGAQELQAGEGDIGRQFQAEQENLARQFQAGQGDVGRKFQEMMADKDIGFKRGLADTEQGNKLKQMDLLERQFEQDKMIQEFNKMLAQQALEMQKDAASKGMLGGLGDQIFGSDLSRQLGLGSYQDYLRNSLGGGAIGSQIFKPAQDAVSSLLGGGASAISSLFG